MGFSECRLCRVCKRILQGVWRLGNLFTAPYHNMDPKEALLVVFPKLLPFSRVVDRSSPSCIRHQPCSFEQDLGVYYYNPTIHGCTVTDLI